MALSASVLPFAFFAGSESAYTAYLKTCENVVSAGASVGVPVYCGGGHLCAVGEGWRVGCGGVRCTSGTPAGLLDGECDGAVQSEVVGVVGRQGCGGDTGCDGASGGVQTAVGTDLGEPLGSGAIDLSVEGVGFVAREIGSGANVVGMSECEKRVGAGSHSTAPVGRGKHYYKNRARREKRKRVGLASSVPEWRRGAVAVGGNGFVGAFEGCSQAVKDELRESRARMMVEKNRLVAARSAAEVTKVAARVKSRVDELKLEEERLKLDAERTKRINLELSKLPRGYAETVVSEGLQSSVPSLSDGSVSPDSSVSVAQVSKMEATIERLTQRVAELVAEGTEREVKRVAALKDRTGLVRVYGGNGYSSWD